MSYSSNGDLSVSMPPKLWWWLLLGLVSTIVLLVLPAFTDEADLMQLSIICIFSILALSMSFMWGYAGMLSFGQTAFFGLGGYSYAVLSLNTGETTLSLVIAIILPAVFAAVLGYFMIYGRISDVYFSVITLVVTLILDKAMRATSAPIYVVGSVRLNGQNGIPGIPDLQVPWNTQLTLSIEGVFYLSVVLLLLIYIGLRMVLLTHFGRVLVGIRENERRAELLGYDSRTYKLVTFVLLGAIAGLAGGLYAVWGNYVAPEMFNLNQAAQVIIWVIVGGKSTLSGPIIGTGVVQYLTTFLGTAAVGQVNVVLGLILMVVVLFLDRGLVPSFVDLLRYLLARFRNTSFRMSSSLF
ncbi:MAG: branched-chain amino acid ABC transporter permease [Pseudomonadota bacterium]